LEASGQLHNPAALSPGKSPRYPFYGGWVDHRTGLDEKYWNKCIKKFLLENGHLKYHEKDGKLTTILNLHFFSG
jgi:hypothetical protein